jgi:hypothetical protein
MNLVERNGLRILTPKLGYILHDKVNDIYSEKVYLGKYANVEDYEEVIKDNIDVDMCDALNELIEENQLLLTILEQSINE